MRRLFLPLACLLIASTTLQSQWTPLGSGLATVRSITSQGATMLAASFPSGVFRSTNGGATWAPSNSGITINSGNHFVESVGRSGTSLFAGTHTGIYRSTDGGATWILANGSLAASSSVFANKFFWIDNVLFATFNGTIANGGGCWRSDNNGNTWNIGHSGMGSNAQVNHLTKVDNTIYACTNVGIYTSTNVGLSWTLLPGINYATFGLVKAGNNLVIHSQFGLRYSTNNGATWMDGSNSPTNLSKGELAIFEGNLYAIVPNTTAMYRSTDNGQSWSAFNTGIPALDLALLEEFFIDGNRLYTGSFTDIYYLQGVGTGVEDLAAEFIARVRPTVVEDAFWVDLPADVRSAELALIDATGRTAIRRTLHGGGTHSFIRGALAAGSYRCVIMLPGEGSQRLIGTVIIP